jgi:hypothetical protein
MILWLARIGSRPEARGPIDFSKGQNLAYRATNKRIAPLAGKLFLAGIHRQQAPAWVNDCDCRRYPLDDLTQEPVSTQDVAAAVAQPFLPQAPHPTAQKKNKDTGAVQVLAVSRHRLLTGYTPSQATLRNVACTSATPATSRKAAMPPLRVATHRSRIPTLRSFSA